MSERQLREGVDCHLCPEEAECVLCDRARKALADEPDVVKAAKRFREQATWAIGTGSITAAHWADYCINAAKQVEEDFGFCLTETGWEWTQEEQPE